MMEEGARAPAARDADPMERLCTALEGLLADPARGRAPDAAGRVRAINCKSYKVGEDWSTFETYFRENVRAAFQYQTDDARLNEACCSWIGAKLEPGPTMTAYQNLPDTTKRDWDALRMELAKLYCNEVEKQSFLVNVGGYKKGTKTMMEYKNELVRLVNLYQPDLKNVPVEYQRQLVNHFIEGIDDPTLQRKLRFHCRKNNTNISEAYDYAICYESTAAETKARDMAFMAYTVLEVTAEGTPATPAPIQAAFERNPAQRAGSRSQRVYPIAPGLTGGPGYVDNTGSHSWTPANPR